MTCASGRSESSSVLQVPSPHPQKSFCPRPCFVHSFVCWIFSNVVAEVGWRGHSSEFAGFPSYLNAEQMGGILKMQFKQVFTDIYHALFFKERKVHYKIRIMFVCFCFNAKIFPTFCVSWRVTWEVAGVCVCVCVCVCAHTHVLDS